MVLEPPILKLSPSGAVLAQWSSAGTHTFDDPAGLALDSQGNMYVVEYEGNRIDKLGPDGTVQAVWK